MNGKFYNGRIEEARVYYRDHPEVNEQYSFEEYVDMEYYEFKKPAEAVKQEIIDLCSKNLKPSDNVKLLYLLKKL